jgi:hypothetical protein
MCAGLGMLALLLSGANQIYAFLGLFTATGVILLFLTWGGFSDSGLEADSYGEEERTDTPR